MTTNSHTPRPPASGTLCLLLPDFRALDTVVRRPEPFALWPIGPRPLLAWWLDEAVRRNVATVQLVATADRPLVEAFVAQTGYWSRRIEILDATPAGTEAEEICGLPGTAPFAAPCDGAELLQLWLLLQLNWLSAPRDPAAPTIDRHLAPEVWVAPHARIHPSAQLIGPCWIGESAVIGEDCRIGPHALVGAGAVVDAGAELVRAAVQPRTYVGRTLRLHEMIAEAASLLDAGRGVRVEITDRFLLAALQPKERTSFARCAVRWLSRIFATPRRNAIA